MDEIRSPGPMTHTPTYSIADKVNEIPGMDAASLIARAEAKVEEMKAAYEGHLDGDLSQLVSAYRNAAELPGMNERQIKALMAVAFDMTGLGGTFDYPLISEIGQSLCRFTGKIDVAEASELEVVRLHIEAMQRVVSNRIMGAGGPIERALVEGLHKASTKVLGERGGN